MRGSDSPNLYAICKWEYVAVRQNATLVFFFLAQKSKSVKPLYWYLTFYSLFKIKLINLPLPKYKLLLINSIDNARVGIRIWMQ
jgi:hypothetical protein